MTMAVHMLEKRLSRHLGKLIEQRLLNASSIILHYVDKPAPDENFDPNVESTYPTLPEKTKTVGGLVHFVTARTMQRQFAEIQAGDAIVTFEGTIYDEDDNPVDLKQMQKLRFELNGDIYVQAAVGKDLKGYWSTVIGGNPLSQTFLLRLSD
jgi:hypothetical protein